jgi:Cu(I)/Ag(I) efflux system periplasmic protein CusF
MKSIFRIALAGALLASATPFVHAGNAHQAATSAPGSSVSATTSMSEGEVKKVDAENGRITIKHGDLKNLGMPPMTMIFRLTDKSLLQGVKPGDKIQFVAEKLNGKLSVTRVVPMQ